MAVEYEGKAVSERRLWPMPFPTGGVRLRLAIRLMYEDDLLIAIMSSRSYFVSSQLLRGGASTCHHTHANREGHLDREIFQERIQEAYCLLSQCLVQ